MSTIKLKRSVVPGKVPTTAVLELGEVAINTYDGDMFIKKDDGTQSIVKVNVDSTTDVPEGTNLYFTNERVDDRVNNLLVEGEGITLTYNDTANTLTIAVNPTGLPANVSSSSIGELQDVTLSLPTNGQVLVWRNNSEFVNETLTTTDVSEGTNLYYTVARANTAIDARVTKSFVDGLNINADLLDGQQGTYYLDWTNTTNKPDPRITITLSGDVTGSGNTTLTDLANGSISITTTVADDSHNHVISNIGGLQTALDNKVDETVNVIAGAGLTGGGALTANVTISHADTSAQASVNNSNGTVIQDITLDTYGHITAIGSVNLDSRYYTESEADSRFVNVTGDTMTGNLVVGGTLQSDTLRYTRSFNLGGNTDLNALAESGFFDARDAQQAPTTGWYYYTQQRHTYDNGYRVQTATQFSTNPSLYVRTQQANTWNSWYQIWTSGTDGAGSGLDADLLDGVQGSNYARTDIAESFANNVTISNNLTVGGDLTISGTTTSVNTDQLRVEDSIITLATGQATPLNDIGMLFQRYASANSTNFNLAMIWDESLDEFVIGQTSSDGQGTTIAFSEEYARIGNGTIITEKIIGANAPTNSFIDLDDDDSGVNHVTLAAISGLNLLFDTNDNDAEFFRIGSGAATLGSATTHFVVDNFGNVGINKDTPEARLDVFGNTNLDGRVDISGRQQIIGPSVQRIVYEEHFPNGDDGVGANSSLTATGDLGEYTFDTHNGSGNFQVDTVATTNDWATPNAIRLSLNARMTSPQIDLRDYRIFDSGSSSDDGNPHNQTRLQMTWSYRAYSNDSIGENCVLEVWNGSSWIEVWRAFGDTDGSTFANADVWRTASVDITPYINGSNLFQYRFFTTFGAGVADFFIISDVFFHESHVPLRLGHTMTYSDRHEFTANVVFAGGTTTYNANAQFLAEATFANTVVISGNGNALQLNGGDLVIEKSSGATALAVLDNSSSGSSPHVLIRGQRLDDNMHFEGKLALAKWRTDAAQATGSGNSKLGTIFFGGNHTNGSEANILYAAQISGIAGSLGNWTSNTDMATDIAFFTGSKGVDIAGNISAGTERMRIRSNGQVGIGTSTPESLLHVSGGDIRFTNNIVAPTTQNRTKYWVWSSSAYGIGMQNSFTYGGLSNDYAMTFQMNNDNTRGFWWGDSSHANNQGAMALTTNGRLTVANSIRVGYGEGDNTTPGSKTNQADNTGASNYLNYLLEVNGAIEAESFVATGSHGILWENGVNRISHNDGGGNVQIRLGHKYATGAEVYTHVGAAVDIESNIDTTDNAALYVNFNLSTNPGAGVGNTVVWSTPLSIVKDGITVGGEFGSGIINFRDSNTFIINSGDRLQVELQPGTGEFLVEVGNTDLLRVDADGGVFSAAEVVSDTTRWASSNTIFTDYSSGGRAVDTAYQAIAGTLYVHMETTTQDTIQLSPNGTTWYITSDNPAVGIFFIVPQGWYYRIGPAAVVRRWYEWT